VNTQILFEEADGVWINMQGKDRPKKGKKCEMKMAAAYDGWEHKEKERYALRNKVMACGFEDSKEFQRKKGGAIASVYNTDEITIRILNGDGGGWIKGGLVDADVHFQLDPFHKNREITRKVKDEKQRDGKTAAVRKESGRLAGVSKGNRRAGFGGIRGKETDRTS